MPILLLLTWPKAGAVRFVILGRLANRRDDVREFLTGDGVHVQVLLLRVFEKFGILQSVVELAQHGDALRRYARRHDERPSERVAR